MAAETDDDVPFLYRWWKECQLRRTSKIVDVNTCIHVTLESRRLQNGINMRAWQKESDHTRYIIRVARFPVFNRTVPPGILGPCPV